MVGSSISGANGSSMRHAKNMPCTNHHGTYVRSMAVDMYEKQLLSGRETIQTGVKHGGCNIHGAVFVAHSSAPHT